MKSARWKITRRKDGDYQVVLHAANGERLVWSEGYTRKDDASRALGDVLKAIREARRAASR